MVEAKSKSIHFNIILSIVAALKRNKLIIAQNTFQPTGNIGGCASMAAGTSDVYMAYYISKYQGIGEFYAHCVGGIS